MLASDRHPKYRKLLSICIFTIFFLILVGGLVRSTGSGLGCPDWPKCFGQYIPPTHISELPLDYKEKYKIAGKVIADFNPVKTWIEYINRLVGATTGILVFLLALASSSYKNEDKPIIYLSWATVFAVGFNGWLGSVVVSTHLKPVIITLHMLAAVFTVFLLLEARVRSDENNLIFHLDKQLAGPLKKILIVLILLTFGQIVLGTQVREEIDHLSHDGVLRELWISKLGLEYLVHRSYSILLVLIHGYLYFKVSKLNATHSRIIGWTKVTCAIVGVNILSGIALAYGSVPPAVQPVHLLFGLMLSCSQYFLFTLVTKSSALEV
ncbi:putative cytochrome oxidase assembly protein [Halobacteriovorax marinus SJ]|uniref:Cytochrome oxidase assembly protein n=1 Tax=Halobacteriovorax marinus (strain ATCC BAA-682 / DSM 15412 / SJ) TaxID=862908 RepID=E1X2V4_HALMS|nr:COX15/CtaA family protein [Halobacteriovorax marinus]CBW25149.1 putative cytochrome oxidase assembly protein [Halobacteriovorax marinus SJ]